jgi:hypothetical protein
MPTRNTRSVCRWYLRRNRATVVVLTAALLADLAAAPLYSMYPVPRFILGAIIEAVTRTLERAEPELAADLVENLGQRREHARAFASRKDDCQTRSHLRSGLARS